MAGEGAWHVVPGGVEVRVRVTPRDAVDRPEALSDGRTVLKIRVRAQPEDGAANEAARRLPAKAPDAAHSAVTLKAGGTARLKTFLIEGDPALLSGRLARLAEPWAA